MIVLSSCFRNSILLWCVVLSVNGSTFKYFMSNLQLFVHFIIEFVCIELPKAESF